MNIREVTPDDNPFMRKIMSWEVMHNTRTGKIAILSCGHIVHLYGSLDKLRDGMVYCERCANDPAPVCPHCEEPLVRGEAVTNEAPPRHVECAMRGVIGSAAHQLKECLCYGGTREDPPGLSKRQAAQLAYDTWNVLRKKG